MKRFIKILMIFAFIFVCENVYAATTTINWCDSTEKVLYQVSYNDSYVGLIDINKENLGLGYVKDHEDDSNYRIEKFVTQQSCTVDQAGLVITCPAVSDINKFNKGGEYHESNLISNGLITISYNMGSDKYEIKFNKTFADKYYIRKSPTINEGKDTNSRNFNGYSKNFYPDSQFLGSSYTFSAKVGEAVILEYYQKDSGNCHGTLIANQYYQMNNASEILVDNPAVTNPNSYIYKMCDKYVRNNPDYLNDSTSVVIKKAIVPVCYPRDLAEGEDASLANKITLADYKKLDADYVINSKTQLDDLLLGVEPGGSDDEPTNTITSGNSCSSGTGKVKCDGSTTKSASFNLYANGDFSVKCTDTFKFTGDNPKLTYAGGGFEYGGDLKYSITRACSIKFIGSPAVKPVQCTGRVCTAITTYYGNISGDLFTYEHAQAGPSEDFDFCISKCDGGKYTQSCINSCYKEVYGEDTRRDESIDKMANLLTNGIKGKVNNLLKYNEKKNNASKVATHTLPNGVDINYPDGYNIGNVGQGTTDAGRAGYTYDILDSSGNKVGSGAASDSYCAIYGGSTSWSCYDVPSGCVWNAEEIYQARLGQIISNHAAAVSAMAGAVENLSIGQVNMTIVDSYLKDNNGKYFSFNINSHSSDLRLRLIRDTNVPLPSAGGGSATIGQRGETVSLAGISGGAGVAGIAIDANAYIGKTYGDVVYNNGNRSFTINKNNSGKYGINPMNSFVDSNYYNGNASNGLAQYFTSLYTNNKNVRVDASGDVSLNRDCYNIEVSVTGVGTSNKSYGTSNSCYYGVYNNYVYTEDDCVGSDCSQAGGKKYIFRPIELTDVFPDREPRWNWTNSASLNLNGDDPYLGYDVKPVKTTEHIEDEGHSILNDAEQELDYEIIIDRMGIARIKGFNRDMKGYTNFDLNCSMRNVTLCKSNFLDSASYITNAGNTRKGDSLLSKNGWER